MEIVLGPFLDAEAISDYNRDVASKLPQRGGPLQFGDFERAFDELFEDLLITRWREHRRQALERALITDRGPHYEVKVPTAAADPNAVAVEVSDLAPDRTLSGIARRGRKCLQFSTSGGCDRGQCKMGCWRAPNRPAERNEDGASRLNSRDSASSSKKPHSGSLRWYQRPIPIICPALPRFARSAPLKSAAPPIELKPADLRGGSPFPPAELLRLSHDGVADQLFGQNRALDAVRLGIGIDAPGYNVFVSGLRTRAERDSILRLLQERAAKMPTPGDWVYVQ